MEDPWKLSCDSLSQLMIGMSQQRLESSASDAANTLCLYCKDLASAISTTLAIIDSATPDQNKHQSVEVDFRRHDTYPTFPSITLSAEEGCQLCSAFITMMHPYLWVDIPPFKGYLRVLCIRKRNQEDIITENTLKIDFRDPDRAEKLVPFIGGFFNLDIRGEYPVEITCAHGGSPLINRRSK